MMFLKSRFVEDGFLNKSFARVSEKNVPILTIWSMIIYQAIVILMSCVPQILSIVQSFQTKTLKYVAVESEVTTVS